MRTIKLLLAAGFLLVLGTSAYAQVQRNETYLPKFAIKTNALYWATSTPNLGFEVGLAKKITLDVSGNYNPWKFGNDCQIKHWLVQPELTAMTAVCTEPASLTDTSGLSANAGAWKQPSESVTPV